jgi:CBS domain-containing protein
MRNVIVFDIDEWVLPQKGAPQGCRVARRDETWTINKIEAARRKNNSGLAIHPTIIPKKENLIMRRVDYMIGPRDFATLKAEVFMEEVVSYYRAEDTGDRLAGVITEGGFGSVPILAGDGKVLGIVSEFDLLKAIMEGKELSKVTAGDIMTKGAISVTQDTPAMEIIQLLQSQHLIRVAVVDAGGKLVGIVSRRDILLGYLKATKPIWTF